MLPYIEIFNHLIPVYGICFFTGMAAAVFVAWRLSFKRDLMGYDVIYSAVIVGVGAIIGSKLMFIAVNLKAIIEYEIPFINVIKGGFVFYGGLIGGIVGLFIYVKSYKLNMVDFFDLFATVLPLGHAIGRIGCFFGGCCYGIEYHGPLSCTYTVNIGNTPLGIPLFPVQLVESFWLIFLFFMLLILYKRKAKSGTSILVYGFSYSIIRFGLEFLRGDKERGFLLGMSTSQILSLCLGIGLLIFFVARFRKSHAST